MKGNITITLFEIDALEKVIDFIDNHIIYGKRSVGIHQDATRHHIHIGLADADLPDCKDIRKYYNRKGVKDCIEQAKNIKFSIYCETDEAKDDMKCLAYPLKEYENFEEIKYREYIKNIDDEDLEKYRAYAYTRYIALKHNKDREEAKKEEAGQRQLSLDQYLIEKINSEFYQRQIIKLEGRPKKLKPEFEKITTGYCQIFEWACDYNSIEENKLSWRWNDIANHVYSIMYRLKIYSPTTIIMFQQKIKY